MALQRMQILLEDTQRTRLELLAQESGRSMSELIRNIMDGYLAKELEQSKTQKALAALDALAEIRAEVKRKHGVFPADYAVNLINDMRDERTTELQPW